MQSDLLSHFKTLEDPRETLFFDASVKRKRQMAALNDDVRTTLINGLTHVM